MISRAISPLDGRYFDETNSLSRYFSEWDLMRNRVRIEVEWLIILIAFLWHK
jgi:adenylosuccinate lyase